MVNNENLIPIPGRLHSVATEGHVTGANEIIDDTQQKDQETINSELIEAVGTGGSIDSRIAAAVAPKANSVDVYTKTETYNKNELNNMITTPNQEYVSVTATSETTSVTDILPATGATNTIYRVGNWDGTQYNDSVFSEYTWNGSTYIKLSTKSQIGEVYDISANHASVKYTDLAAALGVNGANIPQSLQKGGMSIKFVQSSDNKYIQYRLMANEWSIDTNNWAIVNEGVYTENSEFLYVKTDSNDKILYGIQKDGNFYFGAGCPQQVRDYVQQKIDAIIGVGDVTEKIDTINEMIAFFDTINHDTTLRQLLETSAGSIAIEKGRAEAAEQYLDDVKANKKEVNAALDIKVDKEEGKSLINTEYAEGVHYIESPEFAEIKLDAEERILEATYKDGTKLLPAGFKVNGVAEYDGATVTSISNPEFVAVWLDNSNRILLGIKNDTDVFFGYGVPSQIKDYIDKEIDKVSPEGVHDLIDFIGEYLGSTTLQELLDKKVDGEYTDNPEYIEAKVDSNDKIIEATRKDGTKVLPAGIETPKVNLEAANIENKANPEYVEVKVDEEGKLLEGTRSDGTKVIGGNLEVGNNLNVKGDVEVDGNVSYKNGIPQVIIDYIAANTGSGVTNIEYENETGDMYATFDDADGVTDVYMEENGDIYAEIEE